MADQRMRTAASAPGKLMLLGEHAVVYGRPCIVTAVGQRITVTVEETDDGLVHVSAPSLRAQDWVVSPSEIGAADPPASLSFLHAVMRCMAQRHGLPGGLRVQTHSSFSHELGLGSSAAVTIAATVALSEFVGWKLSKAALFSLGYEAVRAVQEIGSGFDLAASIHGGTLYFRPPSRSAREIDWGSRHSGPEIVSLSCGPLPLVVGYSGTKAGTVSLVRRVAQRRDRQPKLTVRIFDGMARLVEQGCEALLAQDWQQLGRAMSLSQSLLDALGVSTPKLAQLVGVAEEVGAYGAKLSGAGGGDCMIALVSDERRDAVTRAIEGAGGEVIPVRTGAPGVRGEGSQRIAAPDLTHFSPSAIR